MNVHIRVGIGLRAQLRRGQSHFVLLLYALLYSWKKIRAEWGQVRGARRGEKVAETFTCPGDGEVRAK
jgi:hypothetical protein